MPSVGENVEKWEPLGAAGGSGEWCSPYKSGLAGPQITKH